jgi:hypothetical protein
MTLVAVLLMLTLLGGGEYFFEDCDDHAHDECTPDCGCIHCLSLTPAILAAAGLSNGLDAHQSAAASLQIGLPDEDWVGSIDHPPQAAS